MQPFYNEVHDTTMAITRRFAYEESRLRLLRVEEQEQMARQRQLQL